MKTELEIIKQCTDAIEAIQFFVDNRELVMVDPNNYIDYWKIEIQDCLTLEVKFHFDSYVSGDVYSAEIYIFDDQYYELFYKNGQWECSHDNIGPDWVRRLKSTLDNWKKYGRLRDIKYHKECIAKLEKIK